MMELLGIGLAAVIASLAWLYDKAWQRQLTRTERYFAILERMPSLTVCKKDPDVIAEILTEVRKLWLVAPDHVFSTAERFLEAIEDTSKSDQEREDALNAFVLAMRRDSTLAAAILPRFWRTRLTSTAFVLKVAAPPKGAALPSPVSRA